MNDSATHPLHHSDAAASDTATTPSLRRGIRPVPRQPDLLFDDSLPDAWFAGDPGLSSFWSAFGILAGIAEQEFIDIGRALLGRMSNPAIIDETSRFLQQEAIHGAVHARMNRVLGDRDYPIEPARRFLLDIIGNIQTRFGDGAVIAWGVAAEQGIGEIGHAVMENPSVLDPAAELPRRLLLWHFYEEVEHQAALYDGFLHVYGDGSDSATLRRGGVALLLVTMALSLPLVSWVVCRHAFPGQQNRMRTWRPILRQLFGRNGLLRGGGANLRALTRKDFHPFDQHQPEAVLATRRDLCVRPEWERPVRSLKPTRDERRVQGPAGVLQTAAAAVGYLGDCARSTRHFLRVTTPA